MRTIACSGARAWLAEIRSQLEESPEAMISRAAPEPPRVPERGGQRAGSSSMIANPRVVLGASWVLFSMLAIPAAGQSVRGTVRDTTGTAVHGGVIRLLEGDSIRGSAVTDELGRFLVSAPRPGLYRIGVRRIGFVTALSEPVRLSSGDTVAVHLVLRVEAVPVRGVEAMVDPAARENPLLSRRGYYERRELYGTRMGFATFIDRAEFDRVNATRVTDALRFVRGMSVRSAGGRKVTVRTHHGCRPTLFIDGLKIRLYDEDEIDDFVAASEVVAIEVYTGVGAAEFMAPCASIVIWTGARS